MRDLTLIHLTEEVRTYLPDASYSEVDKVLFRMSTIWETIAQEIEENRRDQKNNKE